MVGLWLTISVVLNVACGSGVTGTSAMQQRIEHREYKQRQQGGRDNPADHHGRQRTLYFGAGAGIECHGYKAEACYQGGHQYRP